MQQAYASSDDDDQQLIKNLALFLTNYLHSHLRLVETPENSELLINAHLYLIKISTVDDREIFKICLEYWAKLVSDLYEEIQTLPMGDMNPLMNLNLGNINGQGMGLNGAPLRKTIYSDILSNLRLVMIEKMVKPEEVSCHGSCCP